MTDKLDIADLLAGLSDDELVNLAVTLIADVGEALNDVLVSGEATADQRKKIEDFLLEELQELADSGEDIEDVIAAVQAV